MSTTVEQIDLWRNAKEDQHLEFKEAKRQFDNRKLFKYCVALANEGGGHLLLGIADSPPRPVVGTAAFNNPTAMAEKLFGAVGFRVNIEEVLHPDGRVLVFTIPSRPRGTAYHLDGTYLMRSGESLVPMSEDQLRIIFAEGTPNWLEQPSKENLSAQDIIELLDTQSFFELQNLPYPSDRTGVLSRLSQERLIDETSNGYSIRRLGAILLAKSISDFSDISRKAPRVIVYSGISKTETKLDHQSDKGYAVGFKELIQFIMGQLPQKEIIENALRKEVKLAPEIAVRELVANALIHQDFNLTGMSVMIEIYSDRVEISSPGDPLVPVEHFIDGYQSRNERLANIMRRFSICEEKSSGVDKVIEAVEDLKLPAPEFLAGFKRTESILYGSIPFGEMDKKTRIRACYQHCVLQYVLRKQMTNQSLRIRLNLPEQKNAAVSRIITATANQGLIKLDEGAGVSKKHARYLPFWA